MKKKLVAPITVTNETLSQIKQHYSRDQQVKFVCPVCGATFTRSLRFVADEKALCTKCQREKTLKDSYGVINPSQLSTHSKKSKSTIIDHYGSWEKYVESHNKSVKSTCLKKYGENNYAKTDKFKVAFRTKCQKKYGVDNPSQADSVKAKRAATTISRMNVDNAFKNDEVKSKIKSIMMQRYGVENPGQMKDHYSKSLATRSSNHLSKFSFEDFDLDSSWEFAFTVYCIDHSKHIEREPDAIAYTFKGKTHYYYPDFKVDGQLIEIKGDQFYNEQGQMQNPFDHSLDKLFQAKQKCMKDNNVLVLKSADCQKYIDYVNDTYTKDFMNLFLNKQEFPYPNLYSGYDNIIRYFHKSIFEAKRKGYKSPIEAWKDKKLVLKSALNRLQYVGRCKPSDVLAGFSKAKIAPKVSVFKESLAERLVKSYLKDYNEVFDPFSGFSGRMIACLVCGKHYIGQDLNSKHIEESKEIIDYLKLQNVDVNQADSIATTGSYDSLFTCPPYEDKETWNDNDVCKTCDEWIDLCMKNYNCRCYLFVVDNTEKYKDYIVETLENKSHFGVNYEYVLKIMKCN